MNRLLLIFFCISLSSTAQRKGNGLSLNTVEFNDLKLTVTEGIYNITTIGKDPYVFTEALASNLEKNITHLSFEYFCPTGVDFIEVYFYPLEEGRDPIMVRDVGSTEGWVEFKIDISKKLESWGKKGDFLRLDFGAAPDLNIQIRNLQLRSMTEREK